MIDASKKGYASAPHTVTVEAGALRFFAKAIGETDPVYIDEAAAKAAGYASLPVPPTYLFSLEFAKLEPFDWFEPLNVDIAKILHGEQSFVYHRVAVAGETLTFTSRVTDVYDKKNGALQFVVRETKVTDASGKPVADLKNTLVQRNG